MKLTQKAWSLATFLTIALLCVYSNVSAQENSSVFNKWPGEYISRDYFNQLPEMDAKYEQMAQEAQKKGKNYSAEEAKSFFTQMMHTDFARIAFDKNSATFYDKNDKSVTHEYKSAGIISDTFGKEKIEWFGFEAIDEQAKDSPYKYLLLFAIHQHGNAQPHFHMRYGNQGFDALTADNMGNWWPTGVMPDFDFQKAINNFDPKVMAKFLPKK